MDGADRIGLIASMVMTQWDAAVKKYQTDVTTMTHQTQAGATRMGSSFGAVGAGFARVLPALAAVGVSFASLGIYVRGAVAEASAAQEVQAQLGAVLASTGGAAGVTAAAANELATSLAEVTRFSEETILSGENVLLTFRDVGQGVFPRAMEAALNLATAFKQELQPSVVQVGKSLQDPIAGVTALQRIGVQFSASQKAMIKALVETGQQAKAQALILQELETETGNAARAAGQTLPGQMDILDHRLSEIQERIGQSLIRPLTGVTAYLLQEIPRWEQLVNDWMDWLDRRAQGTGGRWEGGQWLPEGIPPRTTAMVQRAGNAVLGSDVVTVEQGTLGLNLRKIFEDWATAPGGNPAARDIYNGYQFLTSLGLPAAVEKLKGAADQFRGGVDDLTHRLETGQATIPLAATTAGAPWGELARPDRPATWSAPAAPYQIGSDLTNMVVTAAKQFEAFGPVISRFQQEVGGAIDGLAQDAAALYLSQQRDSAQFAAEMGRRAVDFNRQIGATLQAAHEAEMEAEEQYLADRSELVRDADKDIQRLEEDHQRERRQMLREHNTTQEENIRANDAVAYLREERRYEDQRQTAAESNDVELRRKREDAAQSLRDLEASFRTERAVRQRDLQRKLTEMQQQFNFEQTRRREDFNRKQADEIADFQRRQSVANGYYAAMGADWEKWLARLRAGIQSLPALSATAGGDAAYGTRPGFAAGGSLVVPSSHLPETLYPVRVSPREIITVTPAGAAAGPRELVLRLENFDGVLSPAQQRQVVQIAGRVAGQTMGGG